jgi:hypothetical protein
MFGNTVSDEYAALAERRNFSRRELVELAKNGFRVGSVAGKREAATLRATGRDCGGIACVNRSAVFSGRNPTGPSDYS